MQGNPFFTVVTVTFNASGTVGRTLRSVDAQTCPSVEHIIVDGQSRDDTMSLVTAYAKESAHPVRYVSEPDKGLYDAMNKAIGMAAGRYILFLNAGDQFHSATTLEDVMAKAGESDYTVLYGETDIVDDDGNFIRHRRLQAPKRLDSGSFKKGMLVCHQSFYALTALARQEAYDLSWRFSADFDWCIRILKAGERQALKSMNTGIILTDYLNAGLTTRNHRSSLIERLRLMAHHYGWLTALAMHAWFVVRAVVKR